MASFWGTQSSYCYSYKVTKNSCRNSHFKITQLFCHCSCILFRPRDVNYNALLLFTRHILTAGHAKPVTFLPVTFLFISQLFYMHRSVLWTSSIRSSATKFTRVSAFDCAYSWWCACIFAGVNVTTTIWTVAFYHDSQKTIAAITATRTQFGDKRVQTAVDNSWHDRRLSWPSATIGIARLTRPPGLYAAPKKPLWNERTQAIQTTKHGASVVAARNLDISPPPPATTIVVPHVQNALYFRQKVPTL